MMLVAGRPFICRNWMSSIPQIPRSKTVPRASGRLAEEIHHRKLRFGCFRKDCCARLASVVLPAAGPVPASPGARAVGSEGGAGER